MAVNVEQIIFEEGEFFRVLRWNGSVDEVEVVEKRMHSCHIAARGVAGTFTMGWTEKTGQVCSVENLGFDGICSQK